MKNMIKRKRFSAQKGFTFIEFSLVIIIFAILLAFMLVVGLGGFKNTANDDPRVDFPNWATTAINAEGIGSHSVGAAKVYGVGKNSVAVAWNDSVFLKLTCDSENCALIADPAKLPQHMADGVTIAPGDFSKDLGSADDIDLIHKPESAQAIDQR